MPKKSEPVASTKGTARPPEAFVATVVEETTAAVTPSPQSAEQWLNAENFEGQLTVDVYQTEDSVVIQSTLAGVRVQDIDIAVNNDMVTIRGVRRRDAEVRPEHYFYQECYWGGFSRSIILPVDVRAERASATIKNGILTVILPKAEKSRSKSIRVQELADEEE